MADVPPLSDDIWRMPDKLLERMRVIFMPTDQDDPRAANAMALPPDLKRWQVRFGPDKGHGQQFTAKNEKAVRAEVARIYGADYAETITELYEIV